MNSRFPILLASLSLLALPVVTHAAWTTNGVPVVTATGQQLHPVIVSDGSSGAIITWQDLRGAAYDIYAQRMNTNGVAQWAAGGLVVCNATGNQTDPRIISDGAGGAIIVWSDRRNGANYDIYAQRINASGAPQWTANGVVVCTAADDQTDPTITTDGSGGVIITWDDFRSTNDTDTYVQRINSSGAVQYTGNGVPVCTATDNQFVTSLIPNGTGAAIAFWYDHRNGLDNDIYAQRINNIGGVSWAANGVAVCSATGDQDAPTAITDGSGGAIVTWEDFRGSDYDIYAQRIQSNGAVQWTANGVSVCTATNDQSYPTIVLDGAGGAIISWYDGRNGPGPDIFAQRINGAGASQWTSDGVAICTATGSQDNPVMVDDGLGGAIIAWNDNRNGDPDVYARRVNASGAPQWAADGVAVVDAANQQSAPVLIPLPGAGAIYAWQDFRADLSGDVYSVRLGLSGTVPTSVNGATPGASFAVSGNHPNPFSGATNFDLELRQESSVSVDVFDAAGRRVRTIHEGKRGAGVWELSFDGRDNEAHELPSGVYFYRVRAGSEAITKKMVIAR